MPNRIVAIVLLALAPIIAHAKTAGRAITKAEVRQAIAIFRREPTSPQGMFARPLIRQFAEDSAEVEIIFGPRLQPWIMDKKLDSVRGGTLLVAFVAGDVASQLDGGDAHGTALVAGCEQVIATYRQLQVKDPGFSVPELEKLVDLQRKGKLAGFVRDAERRK